MFMYDPGLTLFCTVLLKNCHEPRNEDIFKKKDNPKSRKRKKWNNTKNNDDSTKEDQPKNKDNTKNVEGPTNENDPKDDKEK